MTTPDFGAVIFAAIPYSDQQQIKMRPAVVVSSNSVFASYGDLILLSITSKLSLDLPFKNLEIIDWDLAGLPKPSAFKPALFTLEATRVIHVFGALGDKDMTRLKLLLSEMLDL